MRAWLVTWEWLGDHAAVPEKVVAVLNSRTSARRVREIVELLYVNATYCPSERLGYARRRFNPYPARFGTLNGVSWEGQVHCGHNPWLFARLVDDLVVTIDANGEERLTWRELPRPSLSWMSSSSAETAAEETADQLSVRTATTPMAERT